MIERAEIMREKGTNRSKFFRGQIDKYTWVDIGSSYLPSDLLAAVLLAQLEAVDKIHYLRKQIYQWYMHELTTFQNTGVMRLPTIPAYAHHNAHIFYVLMNSRKQRNFMLDYLKNHGVQATFHYIPLHNSPQGKKLGYRKGDFPVTEHASETLIRLPIWAGMKKREARYVITSFKDGVEGYVRNRRRIQKSSKSH